MNKIDAIVPHFPTSPVRLVLLGAALLGLSGCGGRLPPVGEGTASQVVVAQDLPAPGIGDAVSNARPYLIGPFDRLSIDVYGVEDLSDRKVQADASGNIAFPFAGTVQAAGRTPQQVAEDIASRLRGRYVRDPQVSVNLVETLSQTVTVEGQVKEPGIFPVVGRMTLLGAIARSKGVDEFAKLEEVLIFRTVAGQRYVGAYNLTAIRRGNYADPEIYASDTVVVGDSPRRRTLDRALNLAPLLTTPLILLLQ